MGLMVYTGGTFDLPHWGHAEFLQRCAQFGEVVVSLNTDEFIEAYKGKPPIMSYDERRLLLLEFKSVSRVVTNTGGADSTVAIDALRPDIVAIGSDWARKDYYSQMGFTQDWLDERKIMLLYIPYTQGISTTKLKHRVTLN